MLIVDSQVHIWGADTPMRPWPKRQAPQRAEPLGKDELLREMDAAGVDRVIIVPPGWEGDRNDLGLEAARAHPERFAVMGRFDTEKADAAELLAGWKTQPGMLGIRLAFNTPESLARLLEGRLAWFWPAAERADIPLMLLVRPPQLALVEDIAKRHPGLRIALDHLSLPTKTKDDAAFAHLDKLLMLARLPNVAVKASSMPSYSSLPYPYPNIHPHLRRVYDAFGPHRMFWGTDLSRMPGTYREAVTMFTEELAWIPPDDLELIMGRAVCEWLEWPLP